MSLNPAYLGNCMPCMVPIILRIKVDKEIKLVLIPKMHQHWMVLTTTSHILKLMLPIQSIDNEWASPRYIVPLIYLYSTKKVLCGHMWKVSPEYMILESSPWCVIPDRTFLVLESLPSELSMNAELLTAILADASFPFLTSDSLSSNAPTHDT